MTTSNPNAPMPAGGADPDGEDENRDVDPLVQSTLRGAVPDEQTGDAEDTGSGDDPDSVEDDRRSSGG